MKCAECYFIALIILLGYCLICAMDLLFLTDSLFGGVRRCRAESDTYCIYTIIVCIDYILAIIVYTVLPDELQCTYALI